MGEPEYDGSTRPVAVRIPVPVENDNGSLGGGLVGGVVVDYVKWKEAQGKPDS